MCWCCPRPRSQEIQDDSRRGTWALGCRNLKMDSFYKFCGAGFVSAVSRIRNLWSPLECHIVFIQMHSNAFTKIKVSRFSSRLRGGSQLNVLALQLGVNVWGPLGPNPTAALAAPPRLLSEDDLIMRGTSATSFVFYENNVSGESTTTWTEVQVRSWRWGGRGGES